MRRREDRTRLPLAQACEREVGREGCVSQETIGATPPPEPLWSKVAVLLAYLLLALVFTWPLALHWRTGTIQAAGIPIDNGQNIWNLWWSGEALVRGQNPYQTHYLFYPMEIDLFWQTLGLSNALLMAPVILTLGPIAAFNLLVFFSFGFGGYFTYRIVRAILQDRAAAFMSGFIFAFAPSHMQPLLGGALEIVAIHWIPLYLLVLMRMLRRPGLLSALAAAIVLTLTTLSSHYYGLFLVIYTAFHVGLALFLMERGRARFRIALYSVFLVFVWVCALAPFVWSGSTLGAVTLGDWYDRQVFHSTQLVDFLFPNVRHPIWGDLSARLHALVHPFGREVGAAPGVVIYALVAYGLAKCRRHAWPWFTLALAMALFALGPELAIGEWSTGIPLPFRLLDAVSPFRNSSRPSRFIPMMMLPLSIVAGFGVYALRRRLPGRGLLLTSLAGALLLAELAVKPWPVHALAVDPVYARLNGEPAPGAVLELPPQNDDSRYMLNQLCHGRPLVGGYLARSPDYRLATYSSPLNRLWRAAEAEPDIVQVGAAEELAALGIRYVVLNLESWPGSAFETVRRQLSAPGMRLYVAGSQVEVYEVLAQRMQAVVVPGVGWYAAETDGRRTWRWMEDEAELRLLSPTRAAIRLSFDATANASDRPLRLRLDGALLSQVSIPAAPFERTVYVDVVVPAGEHELTLESAAARNEEGRQLSVSVSRVRLESRLLPTPLDATSTLAPPPVIPRRGFPPCP